MTRALPQAVIPSKEPNLPAPPARVEDVVSWIANTLLPFLQDESRMNRQMFSRLTIENMAAYYETGYVTPGVANTAFTITHNLGRVPKIAIWNIDQNGVVYDSNRASWSTTTIELKCTAASAAITVLVL